jgi:hypothetical protein
MNMRQLGLAEAGGSREQNVIERLAASARRLDRHRENLPEALLTDEFSQRARSQRIVVLAILLVRERGRTCRGRLRRDERQLLPLSLRQSPSRRMRWIFARQSFGSRSRGFAASPG